jgi:hypothetical protein
VKVVFQEIAGVEFAKGDLLEILCGSEDSFFVSNDLYRNVPEVPLVKMDIDQLWYRSTLTRVFVYGQRKNTPYSS